MSGRLTNQNNEGIPYATVSFQKTTLNATTSSSGHYSFQNIVPGTYEIRFSSPGYSTVLQEITLEKGEERVLDIQLEEELRSLDEIVITSNRRIETLDEVSSSVSVLSSRQIENLNLRLSHIYSGNRDRFEPKEDGSYTYGQGPVEAKSFIKSKFVIKNSSHGETVAAFSL